MRTLIAIVIVSLVATSTAFARKASHHHFKRAAPKHQSATKTDPGGIAANRGTTLSISRKNRVLRAPATTDACDVDAGDPEGSPFAF